MIYLKKGDTDGESITIVDEDRLCFLVKSNWHETVGIRTISKCMLEEFIAYEAVHPGCKSQEAREALSGKTELDPYEYGYCATYLKLVLLNKTLVNRKNEAERILPTNVNDSYSDILHALRTKPFLLLAGISGTGKSRIVRELAFKSCPADLPGNDKTTPGNYCMIEVKPNWHDSTELLGYYSNISGSYQFTKFVRFLVKAMMFPKIPFFVCLDEMNLAPVEQYFAEFLSILETRKKVDGNIVTGALVESKYFVELKKVMSGYGIPCINNGDVYKKLNNCTLEQVDIKIAECTSLFEKGLTLPSNVFIIGTVNMDDTTHQFSRKVIDRAMTIEMNGGELQNMFGRSCDLDYLPSTKIWPLTMFAPKYVTADEVLSKHSNDAEILKKTLVEQLDAINKILKDTPFQVSFRVLNELCIYTAVLMDDGLEREKAMLHAVDMITLMKILPRIEGDEDMFAVKETGRSGNNKLEQLKDMLTDCPQSIDKLKEMINRLEGGFTRFWP